MSRVRISTVSRPFKTAFYDLINLVLCGISFFCLGVAIMSSVSLMFDHKPSINNPIGWAVVGLLIWIVTIMRVMVDPQGTSGYDPFANEEFENLKPMSHRSVGIPSFLNSRLTGNDPRMHSDYDLATSRSDIPVDAERALAMIQNGSIGHASASRREEIYRAAGQEYKEDNLH